MGFQYGGGEKNESLFQQERANKWTDATIPQSGNTTYLSGASPQGVGPLQENRLYVLISKNAFHALSTYSNSQSVEFSASVQNQYWPAETPLYHIPRSGSTEFISVFNHDGSVVEAWVSLVERTEGDFNS